MQFANICLMQNKSQSTMKIQLKYFTGTGNSYQVLDTCRKTFIDAGHDATISVIVPGERSLPEADLVGFCFPVYAFGIPRICRRYLKALNKFKFPQNAFILITGGAADETGFAVGQGVRLLKKKNCDIIYSAVVEMPANWTVAINPPSKEECIPILAKGEEKSRQIALDILAGNRKFHVFSTPERYGTFGLYKDYLLFRYLGVSNLWRTFRVYDTCNGCGSCAKICPTHSIVIEKEKPRWLSTCEQCMRCVNYCPREAIYQTSGGGTKGRNRHLLWNSNG
jgi:Pyruvate/2-oxoacid:ferredoxin oxidoreductase delta subunit